MSPARNFRPPPGAKGALAHFGRRRRRRSQRAKGKASAAKQAARFPANRSPRPRSHEFGRRRRRRRIGPRQAKRECKFALHSNAAARGQSLLPSCESAAKWARMDYAPTPLPAPTQTMGANLASVDSRALPG